MVASQRESEKSFLRRWHKEKDLRRRRRKKVARRFTSGQYRVYVLALKGRQAVLPRLQRGKSFLIVPDVARLATFKLRLPTQNMANK